ncbi:hypothetical protein R1flu_008406 [Riccia fluitans]|uniref:Uncharacterized protein n=1 Tax=Riccia fluitans TaxID=41844 RepID=A0ABD1YBM3_9MARC
MAMEIVRSLANSQALNQQLQAENLTLTKELRKKKIQEYRLQFTLVNASSGSVLLEGWPGSSWSDLGSRKGSRQTSGLLAPIVDHHPVAWPRRDTTISGSGSTEGGPSFPTLGYTGPTGYVNKNPAFPELQSLNLQGFKTSHQSIPLLRHFPHRGKPNV